MGKVLYTDFVGIDEYVGSLMDNPHFKKAMAKTNLYKFWDGILPEKFKGKSKPFSMLPGGTMVVACKNPVVAQEMSLHKVILISKFAPYAKGVNMRVTDMKFDSQKWTEETA